MKDKKIQVRLSEAEFDKLCALLDFGETVSDFVREAIKLKMTLRRLNADN